MYLKIWYVNTMYKRAFCRIYLLEGLTVHSRIFIRKCCEMRHTMHGNEKEQNEVLR